MKKNNKIAYTINICGINSVQDLRTEIALEKLYGGVGLTKDEADLIIGYTIGATFGAINDIVHVMATLHEKEEPKAKKTLWSKIKGFFKRKK